MGGEPLCPENLFLTVLLIKTVKEEFPNIKIYVWTGYTLEELVKIKDKKVLYVLNNADYLIDGPFIEEQRDITLAMRGSTNQRIINLGDFEFNEC
jgi:anaerobic ribonucleoside-triphosphate reductase activating protein